MRARPARMPSLLQFALLMAFLLQAQASYARVELAPCKNSYSPEQQIQLGQRAAQQVYTQMPVLPDSSPATRYIQQLGQKLVAQAPGYKWPYNFHVADVAEVNAFALPGGTVFVNLGTIQFATNESQLAGVMAHELSHVVLQHSVCNASKEQKYGIIAGLGEMAAGVFLGGTAGEVAQQGIGMTAGLSFLKMSRGAETQADLLGVGILYDAGYDPRGMPQFFEMLQAKYGAGGSQFLSDHPNPGNRTQYIDKEIATFVPRANYVTTTAAFTAIHNQVAGLRAYGAREVSSGAWKTQSPNQTVDNGLRQLPQESTSSPAVDPNTPGAWKSFRGSGFSMDVPGNWQGYGSQVSAMLAPAGGITRSANRGASAVVTGMVTDRYQPEAPMTPDAALNSLVSSIAEDNPGLVAGPQSEVAIADGLSGRSIECNRPAGNNTRGEHDWIVAFPQRDASLRYFVFVAPTPDFEKLRPTFAKMLQTLRLN